MRRPLILVLAAAAVLAASAQTAAPGRPVAIAARPVALDTGNPALSRVGALTYLGGWTLSSGDRRFGGLSSMVVDRGRVSALSDNGTVIAFEIGARGGLRNVRIKPLPAGPGATASKLNRDSESLQRDPAGRLWVGFEGANEIWRYAADFARAEAHAAPVEMQEWPGNGGPEALVRLRDGRFLVLSEEAPGPDGSTEALLFAGDPTDPATRVLRFGYRPPDGYRVTDGAELPDGRLILLNRRFTLLEGVSAILTIADPRAITAGAVLPARAIARLAPPLTVDNMEAMSVEQEGKRTIVWLASDDNFSGLQRTLLMKFALDERR
ncbi:MAG: hypothetical protein JWM75_2107 [Sphingomonas bacterium]|nr:hypothetical protein [Sphingomonas bacterium]